MIEVKIPKEINTYKSKMYMGLTVRQLICISIACAINIPLYIFGKGIIGEEAASWIVMIIAIPFLMCGFFTYNGMPYEKFAIIFFVNEFLYPQKRKYKTENMYEIVSNIKESEKQEKGVTKNVFSH